MSVCSFILSRVYLQLHLQVGLFQIKFSEFPPPVRVAKRSSGLGRGYCSTSNRGLMVTLESLHSLNQQSDLTKSIGAVHSLKLTFYTIPSLSRQFSSLTTSSFNVKGILLGL